jgi:hypothetical protein
MLVYYLCQKYILLSYGLGQIQIAIGQRPGGGSQPYAGVSAAQQQTQNGNLKYPLVIWRLK